MTPQDREQYVRWTGMMSRCYNPSNHSYVDYGGRGIFVCPEWHDFTEFLEWAKQGYQDGLSLDRTDNDEGYSPTNCRWATPEQQARNRRGRNKLLAFGESKLLIEWIEDSRCVLTNVKTLSKRILDGWERESAILTPLNGEQSFCRKGHEFTPENTRFYKGIRICRECERIRVREYKQRKKEQ